MPDTITVWGVVLLSVVFAVILMAVTTECNWCKKPMLRYYRGFKLCRKCRRIMEKGIDNIMEKEGEP